MRAVEKHTCPVCGYPDLSQPPYDLDTREPSFSICPCCGCEFGYNDATTEAKERYRRNWVKQGAAWFRSELKPLKWDLREQLHVIGIDLDDLMR